MAEAVFISGFAGVGIDIVIKQILHQIGNAIRYKKALRSLESLVKNIQPIIKEIQRYRPALNRKNGIPTSQCYNKASAVNEWLKQLDLLLRQASEMVNECTLPWYKGHLTSRKVNSLISNMDEHLKVSPWVGLAQIPELLEGQTQVLLQGFGQIMKENVASSSSSSATASQSLASTGFFLAEPLIVGQERVFAALEKQVIDSELSSVGVVGKGGSGKTLLLKRVFNSEKVRNVFSDGLLLWLTVSQFPSFESLGKELSAQIAFQLGTDCENNMNPEGVKIWMNQSMKAKRFALFLDDVWGDGAKLLEELGVPSLTDPSNSKVIVSSRDYRVLLEMGVNADRSTKKMEDLIEDESWRLFAHHAFPYNDRNPPASIEERTARLVCAKCGGLPLAIKAFGRAMSGITDPKEWEFAVGRLPDTNREALYEPLRWSYDALGRYDINPSVTDPSNSKVIVSSRNYRVLREMGVNADRSTKKMEDLIEDESWRLFAHHAFPYNDRNPPASIEERTARLVCAKCGGLPLAIKAVGRAMAGITDPKEWEFAVGRLPETNSLYDPLRWSYDALGRYDINLQLCFLYLSAYTADQIIWIQEAILLFIGDGLLARKNVVEDERSHNPFEVGRFYINFLADRCLIEPTMRDILRELAIQIAEREEGFYCCPGKGLTELTENENERPARTRLLLSFNNLSSLPESLRAPEISSLVLPGNPIREIPRKVLGIMVSLKVLVLSGTSLQ